MDPVELLRLLTIIRGHIKAGKVQSARTQEQIADINRRGVPSLWNVLADNAPELVEFSDRKPNEHVIGCIPITFGERLAEPDNRVGPCQWGCGRTVQWRPYIPDFVPKACLYCMVDRLEGGEQ